MPSDEPTLLEKLKGVRRLLCDIHEYDYAEIVREAEGDLSTGWQPIETAPKDGTVIAVACILRGKIWWLQDAKWNGLAWYRVNGDGMGTPTHWMKLPAKIDQLLAKAGSPNHDRATD